MYVYDGAIRVRHSTNFFLNKGNENKKLEHPEYIAFCHHHIHTLIVASTLSPLQKPHLN